LSAAQKAGSAKDLAQVSAFFALLPEGVFQVLNAQAKKAPRALAEEGPLRSRNSFTCHAQAPFSEHRQMQIFTLVTYTNPRARFRTRLFSVVLMCF
jgi:hypothetical protein